MPSLKMKTKSLADSLRENNGLHVCQKSSKISKNSFSHVRNFQHEAELDTCISNKQDDSFCSKATVQEIRSDETNCCDLADEEILQVQKHPSPSSDGGVISRMDHAQANFSTIETIFSPIPESIDNDIEPNIYDCGGRENDIILPSCGDNDMDGTSTKSCPYQNCNVSDFFISDMIICSSCDERNSTYTGITEATCLLDYNWDELSRFSADEYMLLPFLEDSIETGSHYEDSNIYSEPAIVPEDSSIYVAIHQLKSFNQESDMNSYPDWDPAECLDPQMFIRNLMDLPERSTSYGPSTLLQESRETKSITLVLDLDETLVHSSLEHCDDADFTVGVFASLKEHTVYVKQRPYVRTFLERVSEMFNIVVFTASQSIYANQLLDILDPDGKFISRRAYRDSCIFADGSYTKDLTVLGVDLAKIVIIDNSPQVFRLQVNNGIPIKSWFDDPSDCALISLLPFLETLVDAEDVRPILVSHYFSLTAPIFKLSFILDAHHPILELLISYLYNKTSLVLPHVSFFS